MPFDYDSKKSRANFEKHGIDFEEAQALPSRCCAWNDHNLIEIPAKVVDEPRYMVVGRISGRHWSAVITYRGENVRIISVRRSRDEEIELYESL
ncbi:MAG: BrnT family toxin [Anaerolineales bacterium]|nr:BrnT family toxin [Anaerolineales bacterium]